MEKKFKGKAIELNAMADVQDLLDDNLDIQWYSKDADTVCVKKSDWNKLYNSSDEENKKYLDLLLKSTFSTQEYSKSILCSWI